MKIKEYALQKNLTQSAIYKAVQRAGYSSKDLTDKNNEITAAGFAILAKIYPDPDAENPDQDPASDRLPEKQTDNSVFDELRNRLSQAEKDLARAETALKAESEQRTLYEKLYNEKCEELKKLQESTDRERERSDRERERLHNRVSEANRLLSQQQELARLASMNPIKRLFAGRKKKQNDTVESDGEVS